MGAAKLRGSSRRTAQRRESPPAAIARRTVLALCGLLLPLIVLEVSLRLFGPWIPGGYDTGPYLKRDERLGHIHVPGFVGWMRGPEYTTQVRISPLGLRDPRTSYEKPPDTFRIVLLGDSFVEGVQVNEQETVAQQLEAILNDGSPRRVEVINAGVAAYGTAQELLFFEQEVQRYQPDVVVLFFFAWNDVKNNSHRLEIPERNLRLALKPYFELDRQGQLNLIPGPPPAPVPPAIQLMRAHSWLYNIFEGTIFAQLGPQFVRQDIEVVGGAITPTRGLYTVNQGEEWERAWRLTTALLARLRDRSAEHGAPLLIASVPGWEVDLDWWHRMMTRERSSTKGLDPDFPMQRLGAAAEEVGVPFLDLLPGMRQATEDGQGPLYYPKDGHWNAAGHAFAARALAADLVSRELAGR